MFRTRILNQISNIASSSSSSLPSSSSVPTHHLITLIRSPIGLPKSSRKTLEALGLHRLRERALHPYGETTAGRILRVKELVHVSNVTEEEGRILVKRRRSEGSGLEPSGRVYGGGKGLISQI
ncbi:mitochondrial 54S ribosomal protein uL30m [Kwoniella pini CBS 10737]|uniref:Large ribosomal subunit protein uL30m n=1 Tax=Kwoniella pini CBS 10737 TaxID=1296096 RepID=A0A1B9ID36_9TREE|nr:ribosomal protein L30 [Kwoniella pini CBS 10737]OCF53578.1 ribosomal protein L30 [Kwoniella pini CBS 10737]